MIHLHIPAVPIAQPRQRQRVVTGRDSFGNVKQFASNYLPGRHPVNVFKATCRLAWEEAWDGSPMIGPVSLTVLFVMPRASAKIWKTKPMPRYHHVIKPDCDNLTKALLDALNGLAWRDDCQVCHIDATKCVASGNESPHVEMRVESLEEIHNARDLPIGDA